VKFAQPIWLLVGLAACALAAWRHRRYDRRQRAALATFASQHLVERLTQSVSSGRRMLKRVLVIAGIASLFLALARPQAGFRWVEAKRKGLDILFAVDTSKSMLAQDVKPNRLTRAKLAVSDLVDKLNGDGVGLIAFAGSAFLQSPVTLDYDAFLESLNALDTQVIPRPGTDIATAIYEAQAAFRAQADREKILVLITDGEDLAGNAITAAEAAAKDGVKIFTVGVGSANGELIPVSGGEFAKDANGQIVKSKLDETTLKKIAEVTGGMYQPLAGDGLNVIYSQGLASFTRHDLATKQNRVALERFQWALFAALCCFVGDWLIGTRRRFAVAALALFAVPAFVQASPQSAEKAYQTGDFVGAQQQYEAAAAKAPAKAELQFNAGSAAYKAAVFDKAADAFQKSLKTEQVKLQQATYYNLGNTQYRLGQKTETTNPQRSIQSWEQAVQAYEAALQIKPDDADARFNRDFVKKKLEELKKQQQQQQQQSKQDQQSIDQKNQQDQKDQQQNQQNQSEQDKKNQQRQDQKQQSKPESGKDQQNKKDQQSNAGHQPQPGQPIDQAGNAPKPDQSAKQPKPTEAQRVPGQMTREEAKELLDSVKNDDHRMPVTPLARGEFKENADRPQKDW